MSEQPALDDVKFVMQSAIARTHTHFESEYGIIVTEVDSADGNLDSLILFDMTAIIGMGGLVNVLIAFSFQECLISALYAQMTEGFDVQPDEVEMYREAAAGEVVNTILGNCTMDLQELDRKGISMTPPVILNQVKTIRRMNGSMFFRQNLSTSLGNMTICLVGPRELFDTRLDYAK